MKRKLSKKQWSIRKKIKSFFRISFMTFVTLITCIILIHFINDHVLQKQNIMDNYEDSEFVLAGVKLPNEEMVKADLLTKNPYSRPGTKLKKINGIVIHYVGNPGTTAQNNRNYFEGLAKKHTTSASSHFVVGLDGEIVQCVPLNEIAYCSNDRNDDTISIEVCHPDAAGKFKKDTYESVVELTAYLCNMFQLSTEDVIRHYDVTGKLCPLYYVEHEDAWIQLKADVDDKIDEIKKEEKSNKDKVEAKAKDKKDK